MTITTQNLEIFCQVTFGPVSIFVKSYWRPWPLSNDLDLCIYDLDVVTGYHHTNFGDYNSNGSGDKNFCQVTFGPVWILVKSDIQKVMHKSPSCIRRWAQKLIRKVSRKKIETEGSPRKKCNLTLAMSGRAQPVTAIMLYSFSDMYFSWTNRYSDRLFMN